MMRQSEAGIQLDDLRRVPVTDGAGVDAGDGRAVELEVLRGEARQIVIDGLGRNRQRDVQHIRVVVDLVVRHVGVGSADLHLAGDSLPDSGLRAGAGEGDRNAGMFLPVFGHPDREQRQQQRRSGLAERDVRGNNRRSRPRGDAETGNEQKHAQRARAGSRALHSEDAPSDRSVRVTGPGIAMGSPASWPILSSLTPAVSIRTAKVTRAPCKDVPARI